ncbi:hypothetical protein BH23ACT11_BH23ACT11_19800 [soil metagenome]
MRRVEISTTLITIRRSRMWTQGQLAEEARVSPTTVSGIESGRISQPHFGTIRKLTAALGVSPEQLLSSAVHDIERGEESPSQMTLEWAQSAQEETFEREVENASLENLHSLQRELLREQGRLQKLYGMANGIEQQREIKRRIRHTAAQAGSVEASMLFRQDAHRRSAR